jgi:four helix bundle protein
MASYDIKKESYLFGLLIMDCYAYLVKSMKEFSIARQLLRSGTSIGANIREAQDGQSKKDFLHKMNISLKEAKETQYRL